MEIRNENNIAEPLQDAVSTAEMQETEAADAVKATDEAAADKVAEAVAVVETAEATAPAEVVETAEAATSAEVEKTAETPETVEEAKPAEPAETAEVAEPAEATEAAETAETAEVAETAEEAESAEIAEKATQITEATDKAVNEDEAQDKTEADAENATDADAAPVDVFADPDEKPKKAAPTAEETEEEPAEAPQEPIQLQTEGLCKRYGKCTAVEGVSFTFRPQCITGVLGRGSSGKTTLLALLAGQCKPSAGTVTLNGKRPWENTRLQKQICFSRELFPSRPFSVGGMTVKKYMRVAARYYDNWDKEYADRLLKLFRIKRGKHLRSLSRGRVSLVSVALALASRAPLTLLDEPFTGLDTPARTKLCEMLREACTQEGRTFVVASHVVEEAEDLFDDVIILNDGKPVLSGARSTLLSQFCYVSGREADVEVLCNGKSVLSNERLGRSRIATLYASMGAMTATAEKSGISVDITEVPLTKLFAALTTRRGQ